MTVQLVASYGSGTTDPREFARFAEGAGFDGIGVTDHVFRATSSYLHPFVSSTAIAETTSRCFVTTAFANNLFRSPVEFAQAALSIQWLSAGRFEAGLGAGWLQGEIEAMGLDYPDPPTRARRYREAVQIVRELLATGSCSFQGEHYDVDVPTIGPTTTAPPPLVGALGGPWTIRHIAPLVDRVELVFGASTRGGDLDMAVLGAVTLDDLRRMIDQVRAVAPDVPIGVLAMIAVGDDGEIAAIRDAFAGGLHERFVGSPARVLDGIHSLAELGISRVQVNERVRGSLARLGPV